MKKFDFKKHVTVTNILIVILILIYILDRFLPFPSGYDGYNAWDDESSPVFNYILGSCGGLLTNYMAVGSTLVPNGLALYRRLTNMFLHGHILHLIANLVGLYFIGNYAEKRFGWLTYVLFTIVSFVEGFITDPLYAAITSTPEEELLAIPTMGASGGIFGLIGVTLAAIFFDIKSFKKIDNTTIIVSAVYGFLTTYVVSFGWTTVCHNVAMILGLIIGVIIILPFFLLKKGKFAPQQVNGQTEDNNAN